MKLVFAHDHTFYSYNNQYYSTGGLSSETLKRYTDIFEEVVVVSRQIKIIEFNDKLTLASTERVKFVEIPNFKSLKNSYKIFEAIKIIKTEVENCDAVISRLPSSIGSIAVKQAEKLSKPYIIELVACAWDEFWNHSIKGKLLAPWNYLATRRKVGRAKNVLYVTNSFLQHRYPNYRNTINCSNVALQEFDEDVLKERIAKIRNMSPEGKIIIGTTAALNVKYKGQQYIIQALGEMKKKGFKNFEYQLVGSGNHEYLEAIAKKYEVIEQIKFIGPMPHNEIFNWLKSIDLYAQPSKQEGLPRALIEAMSMGVPAIGAKTAGIPELIEEEYIFSNSNRNIKEICHILEKLNLRDMKSQAKLNFANAKSYDKKVIDERRRQFLMILKQEKS